MAVLLYYYRGMLRKLVTLTALAVLAACAGAQETVAPDGRKAYALDCSGSGRTWAMCLSRAGEVCPKGYDVIAGDNSTAGPIVGASANAYGATLFGAPVTDRSMLIACR